MPIYKTNKKKDGKQQYRVRVNYTDRFGDAKQITRVAYGAAEAKLLETQLQQELAEETPAASMTVRELYDEYMENKRHEVRETTYDKSKRVLNANVLPELKDTKISKLTNPVLQKWKNGMSERKLGIRTKQNVYSEFRAMLNYAVRMDYLPKNPLTAVGNFKDVYFEMSQDKIHYYTADQFRQYIAVAKKHTDTLTDWGYYVFFNIAFFTGMRKGEINALKWSDIDGDIIHVRRSVSQKVKGVNAFETPPKNRSSYRDLQVPSPLSEVLKQHKTRQMQDKHFTDDFRVCGGIACLSDTSLSNKNIQYATEAGLPVIRIHDFRHSHVSLLANEGINIQEIARRLGHAKIEMTWNTYSHLYPREEERAIEVLNKVTVNESNI